VSVEPRATSPYLLVGQVAALLGCSVRTVHELARLRQLPHRRPPGCRRLLFLEDELREWLDGAELDVKELRHNGRAVRPKRSSSRGA
jgi:excisionase family DNA binding protein